MFTKYSVDNNITKRIIRPFSLRGAFLEDDLEAERGCGKCANLRTLSEIIPATVRRWRTATGLTTRVRPRQTRGSGYAAIGAPLPRGAGQSNWRVIDGGWPGTRFLRAMRHARVGLFDK